MLFNSAEFIFLFLPITWIVFQLLGRKTSTKLALFWLVLASLFFYGWWEPRYVLLILVSIIVNFSFGAFFSSQNSIQNDRKLFRQIVLAIGISANLGLIGYYKYANFFVDNLNRFSGYQVFNLEQIILPLAISFFTFQQIAYLVDAYRGESQEHNFLQYCLFIVFFPQLIAGPIVHHKEMLPQFGLKRIFSAWPENLAIGISIFALGLFKKVVIADSLALYVSPVFSAADSGVPVTFFAAWGGALAYTFQLYFDFSGYSDMAIGISRMFGIRLPLNFFSPYKSTSIIDFWRRWHITLSRFLRDYLYIPLGGSRKGKYRRHINLMITMVLGGLWHGAGWTFIVWGTLHGVYLIINHGWRVISTNLGIQNYFSGYSGRLLTFFAVVFAWVFFRAQTMSGAFVIVKGMLGLNGAWTSPDVVPMAEILLDNSWLGSFGSSLGFFWIAIAWSIAWYAPNTEEFIHYYRGSLDGYKMRKLLSNNIRWKWQPTFKWSFVIGGAALVSIAYLGSPSDFLYFQF